MWIAITRDVSASLGACELTHLSRRPIDVALAREQHDAYRQVLASLGFVVVSLPALDEHPDAVFVEDTAIVLDELAVLTRPGAASRRGEVAAMEPALEALRPLVRIEAPATLDGGDVLRVGRTLFVGRGTRTDAAGVAALRAAVAPAGYEVLPVDVAGALHLKSAVSALDERTLLVDRSACDAGVFAARGLTLLDVPADEPAGANVLALGADVLVGAAFPGTARLLARRGHSVYPVDNGELLKAEAGLTCCSLLLRGGASDPD